jgi:hypothetical protein
VTKKNEKFLVPWTKKLTKNPRAVDKKIEKKILVSWTKNSSTKISHAIDNNSIVLRTLGSPN